MGFTVEKSGVALLGLVMVACVALQSFSIEGAVYKVGDTVGWTTIGNFDYRQWAASKTFHVGDIVLFEYNVQFHNVMQVNHTDFQSCNTSSPYSTHTSGNDSIAITRHGHHFFLCGVPGHCQSGQKVDINAVSLSTAPTPAPSGSDSPPSSVPAAIAPAAAPSDAAPLYVFTSSLFGKIGFTLAVLLLFFEAN